MNADFISAIQELGKEKGIDPELLFQAVDDALVAAYKKNTGTNQNVRVEMNKETGEIHVYAQRTVVEGEADGINEMTLEDAQAINPQYLAGDIVEVEVTPKNFGRIAAQNAKQFVVQRIREAERGQVYERFQSRANDIVTGIIERMENQNVYIDLGKVEAVLTPNEQIPGEIYQYHERMKTYIVEVKRTNKGPQIMVSRTHPGLLKRLFELEVPEIYDGTVEIKSVAREPGARSKVAVFSREANLDPVGACVGPKGSRVRMVVEELRNERVDVIQWSPDPAVYVANALSPAKVSHVSIDEDNNYATVIVPDDQLSLAIGKEGQNARLAARLTGWHIDIKPQSFQGASLVDVEMDDEVEEDDGFCIFVDEDGNRCRNHARPNSQYCGVHADAEAEA